MRVALVLGGASCVWTDMLAALELGEVQGVVACNDAAAAYPGPFDAAVSLHPERWGLWMERRRRRGYPMPRHILGHKEASNLARTPTVVTGFIEQMAPGQTLTGSSGLLAVKAALVDLGYDRAVICGVPMDGQPHFFDQVGWRSAQSHWRGWVQAKPFLAERARSMSGRTRELLGAPNPDWFAA